jgi:hypothetical protein
VYLDDGDGLPRVAKRGNLGDASRDCRRRGAPVSGFALHKSPAASSKFVAMWHGQGGSASGIRRIKGPVWPGDRESPTSRGAQMKKCPDDPRLCSPGNLADGVLQRKATQGTEVHPQCEREPHQMSASVGTSIASITPAAIATGLVSVAYAPGASLPRGDHVAHKALHLAYAVRGYYHRWTNWGTRREMRGSRSTRSSCRVQNAAFSSPLPPSLLSKGGPGQAAKSLAYKLPRRTRPPFVNRWMKMLLSPPLYIATCSSHQSS